MYERFDPNHNPPSQSSSDLDAPACPERFSDTTFAMFAAFELLAKAGFTNCAIRDGKAEEELARDLTELRRLRAIADEQFLKPAKEAPHPESDLMTPQQAAAFLNKPLRWIYRHGPRLSFARRMRKGKGKGAWMYSRNGAQKWLDNGGMRR